MNAMGMRCQVCAMRVRSSLLSHPGVLQVLIDLSAGLALVHCNAERIARWMKGTRRSGTMGGILQTLKVGTWGE